MSKTYTVENVWDIDGEEDWFNFNEPSFGPIESFEVGDLSFELLKDYDITKNVTAEMVEEFDAVECQMPALPITQEIPTGLCLGTGSLSPSNSTVHTSLGTLNVSPSSVKTPSMPELAELRYMFYSQNASVQQQVAPTPVQPLFIPYTNFNDLVPFTHSKAVDPPLYPIKSPSTPIDTKLDLTTPKGYRTLREDLIPPKGYITPQEDLILPTGYMTSHEDLIFPKGYITPQDDLLPPKGYKPPHDDLPSPNMMHSVIKFKEVLSMLDTESFDDYISRVSKYRMLSNEEKDESKLISRRIKNREAARRSRKDKKNHVTDLEKEMKQLKIQVQNMHMELLSLRAENSYLKNEIQFSANIINSNPTLTQLFTETTQRFMSSAQATFCSGAPNH